MGARHIFHVGPDGNVQGDATFGGDYRTLPPDGRLRQPWSSSSSVSSASSASTTRSPPQSPHRPNLQGAAKPASSATLPPSKSVQSLPPRYPLMSRATKAGAEMTSSTPELASAGAAPLHADREDASFSEESDLPDTPQKKVPPAAVEQECPRIAEEPTISPQTQHVVEAAAAMHADNARPPSPDTFSNLEMGNLLEEFMCEWDDRRNTVDAQDTNSKISHRAAAMEDTNRKWDVGAANGDADSCSSSTSGNTPRPGSLHLSSTPGAEGGKMSRGGAAAVLRSSSKKKASGGAAAQSGEGAGEENPPYLPPLHNMIIKDSPSNPTKTYRRVPASAGSPPTGGGATGGKGGRDSPDDICKRGEGSEARLRVNLDRSSSLQDKKDEINFVRLSTSPPQKAENDYIDTSTLVRSNPNSPAVDGISSRQPFVTSMSTSSSSSSERTSSPLSISVNQKVSSGDFSSPNEYEELSEASSEPAEDVVHPMPSKSVYHQDVSSREVGRSQSMRVPVSRPATEDLQAKRKGQFGRSRSMKETAATARAQEVYAELIGGRISGSPTHHAIVSPPVSASPRGTGSPSKNPFLDAGQSPTVSPPGRRSGILERMSSMESSDGSNKEGWRNSTSDRDSRELQFGPGDSQDESVEAAHNKHEASIGVKALRSRFDGPSSPARQTPEAPLQVKKPPPPKVPPRGPRSQKPPHPDVVKSTANIVLNSPSGITHSPKGLNNNYSPEGDGHVFGSLDSQSSIDVKLSPRTLQSLEKVMPRRVRRPVGEGRIKRRSSSDVSDSDSDASFLKYQSGDFAARTAEGDSSSDETTPKSLGEERGVGGGVFGVSSPRLLPDLPEDQTNRNTAKHPFPPSPQPRVPSLDLPHTTHHQRGPAGSPHFTQSQAKVWTNNEVERVDLADFSPVQTPPRTPGRPTDTDSDSDTQEERYVLPPTHRHVNGSMNSNSPSGRNPLMRGHTVDVPVIPKRRTTNPFLPQSHSTPPLRTSQSLDMGRGNVDGMGNLVRASPEDIRQLVGRLSASQLGESSSESDSNDGDAYDDYIACRFDNDDLSDLPSRLPPAPPVPSHDLKEVRSKATKAPFLLDTKIPSSQAVHQNDLFIEPPFHAGATLSPQASGPIREAEYEIMRPQRDSVIRTEVSKSLSSTPPSEKGVPLALRELPPRPPPDDQPGLLTRSRSAHSFSHSGIPGSQQLRERRGTLASTRPSETLLQIDEQRPGTKSLDRLERKSRSSDDLQDNESGLKEAESLTDFLARTYTSPPGPDIAPVYASPRPQQHPPRPKEPPPPSVVGHKYQTPPPLPHPASADYIDMSHQTKGAERRRTAGLDALMAPDGGHQKALDVQLVKRELPEEVTEEECAQVLKVNLWNIPLSIKILKVRYLMRTLLLDDSTCRQALEESNWDLDVAATIIGEAPESSISL